jgi:hypothetical protein
VAVRTRYRPAERLNSRKTAAYVPMNVAFVELRSRPEASAYDASAAALLAALSSPATPASAARP